MYSEREMFTLWHCKLLKLHSIGDERMIMENWYSDADSGELKY